MCGILGVISPQPVPSTLFKAALQTIHHRGPDDKGIALLQDSSFRSYALDNSMEDVKRTYPMLPDNALSSISFGHARLSILDLSMGGHQPYISEDGRYMLVFNGEIYNYKELRSEFGFQCQTSCDTEVLLKSFIQLGPDCVKRFIGMWSFAIYDRQTQSLFASRDPFGIKPFYYQYDSALARFVFASEIKAILKISENPKPNHGTLFNFLANGIKDVNDQTFFAGIQQLEPGHSLWLRNGKLSCERYCSLEPTGKSNPQEVRRLFEESLALHMRSDVEVGIALSGGIDSTIIAASLATRYPDVQPQHFSGVYPGHGFDPMSHQMVDESPYIDATVKRYGLLSHRTTPTLEDVTRNLETMIWHDDNPVRVIGVFLTASIYQLAADHHIKVLLGGQGADETFAGYSYFAEPFLASLLGSGQWVRFLKEYTALRQGFAPAIGSSFARYLAGLGLRVLPRSVRRAKRLQRFNEAGYLEPSFIRSEIDQDYFLNAVPEGAGLESALIESFNVGLRDYLDYEDKMSMKVSIESRVPFLNLPFVRYGLGISPKQKIMNGQRKAILREQFADLIPLIILERKDKTGYASPLGYWMNNLTSTFEQYLGRSDAFVADFFRPGVIARMRQADCNKSPEIGLLLWRALSVEIWHRLFFR